MNVNNLSLEELFDLRGKMMVEGLNVELLSQIIVEKEKIYIDSILEDGPGGASAAASTGIGAGGVGYATATIGGMGPVSSPQPSVYAGSTTEPAFSLGGGKIGSGDIGVPYNPGGRKKTFQKIAAPLSDRRGSNKRRKNKILRGLKDIFANRQDFTANQGGIKKSKVMDFDKFSKDQFTQVTKVKQ
jgi:hypothetical protein